jgi:hypothetical protein
MTTQGSTRPPNLSWLSSSSTCSLPTIPSLDRSAFALSSLDDYAQELTQEEYRSVIDFIAQVEPPFGALYQHFTQTRLIRVVPLMHHRDVTLLVELIHDGQ